MQASVDFRYDIWSGRQELRLRRGGFPDLFEGDAVPTKGFEFDQEHGEVGPGHPGARLRVDFFHVPGGWMSRKLLDLWVGFFVALGLAGVLFLALKVGNLSAANFSEAYPLTAKFANIGGLKVRAPVKSAGVVVGRVADVRFDPETYEAVVTFSIDGRYHFPKDTFALILTSGLLGEQYIGLDPGGDEKMLKPGDVIAKTQSAVVLEKLISQFMFNKASEGPTENK
jgi:phospholipid/cholesterol/gamma-HCH transport system substrate-binding protein